MKLRASELSGTSRSTCSELRRGDFRVLIWVYGVGYRNRSLYRNPFFKTGEEHGLRFVPALVTEAQDRLEACPVGANAIFSTRWRVV